MATDDDDACLKIETFGGLVISLDCRPTPLQLSNWTAALLIILAAERRPVSKHQLLSILCSDCGALEGNRFLEQLIEECHALIPGYIENDPHSLSLNPYKPFFFDRNEVDFQVSQAQELLQLDGQLSRSLTLSLERVLQRYDGPFLKGFWLEDGDRFNEWVTLERTRLALMAFDGYEILASLYGDLGELDRSIYFSRKGLDLQPLNEVPYQRLMQLYINAGRRQDAVSVFHACRSVFRQSLDRHPGEKIQALFEAIQENQPMPNPQIVKVFSHSQKPRYLPPAQPAFFPTGWEDPLPPTEPPPSA